MEINELQQKYTAELLLLVGQSKDVGTNDENILPSSNLKLFDIDLQDLLVNDAANVQTEGPLYHIKLRQNKENIPDDNQEWVHKNSSKLLY